MRFAVGWRAMLSALALVLAANACAGNNDPEITKGARSSLTPLVAKVRRAAESCERLLEAVG